MKDPVFRAHYLGTPDVTHIERPASAFDVPKQACSDPRHNSCGDCLKDLWYHDRIRNSNDSKCSLCHLMRLTIRIRRNQDAKQAFEEFDKLLREHLEYVCRVVDARHLISFIINYSTCADGPERAASAAAVWFNMAEKVSVSTPARRSVIPKTEMVPCDGRFVKESTFANPASNFTMFNWNGGDAMVNTINILLDAMRDAPVTRRITMAIFAWACLYDVTNVGIVRKHGKEKTWIQDIFVAYTK